MEPWIGSIPMDFESHPRWVVRIVVGDRSLKDGIDPKVPSKPLEIFSRRSRAPQHIGFEGVPLCFHQSRRKDFKPRDRLQFIVVRERYAGTAQGWFLALVAKRKDRNATDLRERIVVLRFALDVGYERATALSYRKNGECQRKE